MRIEVHLQQSGGRAADAQNVVFSRRRIKPLGLGRNQASRGSAPWHRGELAAGNARTW